MNDSDRSFGHAHGLVRLAVAVGVVTLAVCVWRWPGGSYTAGTPRANLAAFLAAAHGLTVDPADIVLAAPTPGLLGSVLTRPVFFLAKEKAEAHDPKAEPALAGPLLRDAWVSDVVFSPAGVPLHASAPVNLSRTSAADESVMVTQGLRAAFAATEEGRTVVTVVDRHGEGDAALASLDRTQRFMNAVTNLQETGHVRGIDRRTIELASTTVPALRWSAPGTLAIGSELVYDARRGELVKGTAQVRMQQKSRRQPLHWAVDTVRGVAFVGPQGIAWLEDVFFELLDHARQASGMAGTARDELLFGAATDPGEPKVAGWPPPPFAPVLRKPEKGEGEWTLMHDPFIGRHPDAPAPFAQAFVRPDQSRPYAKVFFVAWDPQQVSLNMVAGTRDPRSQTGVVGEGVIPRDDSIIRRLVGGFNGGWQSIHGQYGMMSDGKLVARPLPFCATAVRFKDGTFGIGSWPNDDSIKNIPIEIQSFRQNLFSIAEDGKFNPYGRQSWGGGPGFITGTGPTTHIIRSGLCITKDQYPVYAWGESLTGETLATAMIAAGCQYAMELDINAGHAGFEFYRVLPTPPGGLKKGTHWEGVKLEKNFATVATVPGRPDLTYAMRRLSRHMGIMPFPRYIGKDWRDFMYLTLRPVLPGAPLTPPGAPLPGEGHFTAAEYYQGPKPNPPAVATTFVQAGQPAARVELLRVDLRRVDVTLAVGSAEPPSTTGQDLRGVGNSKAASATVIAQIGLGVGRAAAPRGLVNAGQRHAVPRPHLDTLALLAPLTPEGPPRVAVGAWGAGLQSAAGQVMLVQGAPPGEVAAPAPGLSGTPAAGLTAAPVSRRVAGLGLDADGILVYAASATGDQAAVRAALGLAGCTQVALFGGAGAAFVRGAKGGWLGLGATPSDGAGPAGAETRLVLTANPRWGAARVFTKQAPEKRNVWMKLLGAKGSSNKLVHHDAPPASQPVRPRRHGTPR